MVKLKFITLFIPFLVMNAPLYGSDLDTEEELMDPIDRMAVHLEQDRLRNLFGERLPKGFTHHFLAMTVPYVRDGKLSFRTLEERLRKWKTGIYLLAVESRFANAATVDGRPICIFGIKNPLPIPSHGIFISSRGPELAKKHKAKFGITDEAQNQDNLDKAGTFKTCDGA